MDSKLERDNRPLPTTNQWLSSLARLNSEETLLRDFRTLITNLLRIMAPRVYSKLVSSAIQDAMTAPIINRKMRGFHSLNAPAARFMCSHKNNKSRMELAFSSRQAFKTAFKELNLTKIRAKLVRMGSI